MSSYRTLGRRTATKIAAAAVVVAVGALTACGTDSDSGSRGGQDESATSSASAGAGKHNAADVTFARGMIPHHQQAVEMSDLAPERAESSRVRKLALEIRKAQGPEIKTMTGWLRSWDEPVPDLSDDDGGHGGHGAHGDDDMQGMLTDEDMDKLAKSKGKAFDTAFMELMIEHHEGAVEMARTQQSDGAYKPAKDMAKEIISAQEAEITEMNKLLGGD